MYEKSQKMANLTYSVIHKSCNKVMIGKTFWKSVALPSILYGTKNMNLTKTDIQKLQKEENKVYRQILGAPSYAQIATLRGEIGSSSMERRIMEGKIMYYKSIIESVEERDPRNELLKKIVEDMIHTKRYKWMKEIEKSLEEIKLRHQDIKRMDRKEIKEKLREWDTEKWKKEMLTKSSLKIYRKWKTEIKEENDIYDNTPKSIIFYRCRANILKLNDRNRFGGGNTKCYTCENEDETLEHFLLHCPEYTEIRTNIHNLQQPYIEDTETIVGNYQSKMKTQRTKEEIN